jgi:type II secretory pathway predicted ATPase ExeA
LNHFKLREQPFRLTPDPEFVYLSKQHARAKAYMESTIWLADGFVVITGEIGSGKTTLLQSFLKDLDEDVLFAVVSQTQLNATQFLQAILTEFGFKPFNLRKVELLDMLNMFLIEQYSNGKKVVLIVDEAQNLSHRVLEEVRMLSGVETHKEKVLRIILTGQPELKETLESPKLKQLMQRIRLRFHLGPLNRQEVGEYVRHRLSVAGNDNPALIADACYDIIYRYTGGLPRLINTFCDTALLCAFAEEARTVEPAHFLTAAEELNWQEYRGSDGPYRRLSPALEAVGNGDKVTQIEVRSNGVQVSVHSFPKGRFIIGRSPENDIYIRSKFVSRHHAQLINDDDGCLIEDLNSTNGVFIDDRQVKRHRLQDGDIVSLGAHELVYRDLRPGATRTDDEASAAG